MKLMKQYLHKNNILVIDNGYSNPTLFEQLYNNSTGAIGTVRKTRTGMAN